MLTTLGGSPKKNCILYSVSQKIPALIGIKQSVLFCVLFWRKNLQDSRNFCTFAMSKKKINFAT